MEKLFIHFAASIALLIIFTLSVLVFISGLAYIWIVFVFDAIALVL